MVLLIVHHRDAILAWGARLLRWLPSPLGTGGDAAMLRTGVRAGQMRA
jgi:hypothetical protein